MSEQKHFLQKNDKENQKKKQTNNDVFLNLIFRFQASLNAFRVRQK